MRDKEKGVSKHRLIQDYGGVDVTALPDLLLTLMYNVEEALLECGAVPGEDYNYRDLIEMATPFALSVFGESGEVSFVLRPREK